MLRKKIVFTFHWMYKQDFFVQIMIDIFFYMTYLHFVILKNMIQLWVKNMNSKII